MARPAVAWTLTIALWIVIIVLHQKSAAPQPNADGLIAAGMALHQKGDLAGALRQYEAAASADPQSAPAFYNIGVVQYQRHQALAAESAYRRAIEINPRDADTHFNLGYLYLNDRRDYERALREFGSAIEANPALAKAYFQIGRAYDALGQHQRALDSWQTAVRMDPALRDAVAREADRP